MTRAALLALASLLLFASVARSADETGIASHYGPGNGVAMPFCTWVLRHSQGCGSARITSLDTGITVTAPIVDYCACVVPGSAHPYRIVDLQWGVVAALGLSRSAGLYPVRVELVGGTISDTAMSQ